jgi:hypothetical protein
MHIDKALRKALTSQVNPVYLEQGPCPAQEEPLQFKPKLFDFSSVPTRKPAQSHRYRHVRPSFSSFSEVSCMLMDRVPRRSQRLRTDLESIMKVAQKERQTPVMSMRYRWPSIKQEKWPTLKPKVQPREQPPRLSLAPRRVVVHLAANSHRQW